MQSTVAIKAYLKRIFFRKTVVKGQSYTYKTFRFDFLINPMLTIYIIVLLFLSLFSVMKFFYFIPLILYFFTLFLESLRLSNFSIRFINLFFQLFICTLVQSIAGVLLFFNLSIDLKKHYRNVNDNYSEL